MERPPEPGEGAGDVESEDEEEGASPAELAAELAEVLRRVEQEAAEEPLGASHVSPSERCVVPELKGDTLRVAQRMLARDHCRLGKVTLPHRHRGRLVVTHQSRRVALRLADRTVVGVKLGPAPKHRHS